MKFSLIVPTIGRKDDLERLLHSLQAQTLQDFETIIVDQSRSDELIPLIEKFSSALRISHVKMDERGASRGRNRGLEMSIGEICTYPDDDCTYPPNLLETVAQIFDADSGLDAFSARSENEEGTGAETRFDRNGGRITKWNVFKRQIEFAVFYRHDALSDLRFDPNMGPGAGTPFGCDEGLDLLLRLIEQGARVDFRPDLVVYHPVKVNEMDDRAYARCLSYSRGRGYFLRKHQYPLPIVAYWLSRPLAGCFLSLLRIRPAWARYYWQRIVGTVHGYMSKEARLASREAGQTFAT
jgi:glycosyltransferase involved in cell wall biosynthesis